MRKQVLYFLVFLVVVSNTACSRKPVKKIIDTLTIEHIMPFQEQHCHGSTLVELPNKDLLVAWFQGSGERTADDVVIKGARYNHRTGEWGTPFLMADTPGFPDINPVLFIDSQSRLWLTWYTVMAYQWSSSLLKYRISDNYMQKAGAPEWLWQEVLHVKADGQPTEGIGAEDQFVKTLSGKYDEYFAYLEKSGQVGESAIPRELLDSARHLFLDIAKGNNLVANGSQINEKGEKVRKQLGYPLMRRIGWQTRNKPLFIGERMLLPLYSDMLDLSLMAITEDGGQTWSFSEPILGGAAIQPALAMNKDGSLTILMRDNGPPPQRLQKSVSKDLGITWSTGEDTDIPNPGSAADLVVLKSGSWALVSNDLEEGRHRLSVWLSEDEGVTWPFRKQIINGPAGSAVRAHYPAIIQGKDGMIHVSFTHQVPGETGKPEVKTIAHALFTEQWIKSESK